MTKAKKTDTDDTWTTDETTDETPIEPVAVPDSDEPTLGEHVLIDPSGTGSYGKFPIKDLTEPFDHTQGHPRTIHIKGVGTLEHTDTHPSGVWSYRKM